MKKLTIGLVCGAIAAATAFAENAAEIGSVRLKGYLGERLDAMIERHVCGADVDYITAPFMEKTETKGWWQTEFWGKWMHSAVPYLGYCGSEKLRASIDRGIDRMLASQEPNGYIGNYPDELRCGEGWDVWGMKYTMMGLMHYYDGSRSRSKAEVERGDRALTACRRLCDYVIGELGPNGRRGHELWTTGNWSGLASSSILEPVVWLYNRTDDRKYLDFASYIVKGMCEPEAGPRLVDLALKGVAVADRNGFGNKPDKRGEYVMKHNRWKAYEMMSCYQGLLEYVEAKSRADGSSKELDRLRRAAVLTGEDIAKIMNDTQKELDRLCQYHDDLKKEIRAAMDNPELTDADVEDYVKAANLLLEKQGIKQFTMPKLINRQARLLMMKERRAKLEAQQKAEAQNAEAQKGAN